MINAVLKLKLMCHFHSTKPALTYGHKKSADPPYTTRALHCLYTLWLSLRWCARSIVYRFAPTFSAEVQVRVVNLSKYVCIPCGLRYKFTIIYRKGKSFKQKNWKHPCHTSCFLFVSQAAYIYSGQWNKRKTARRNNKIRLQKSIEWPLAGKHNLIIR